MKKKRGAQPANKNALKHGIYSAAYKAGVARLLEKMPVMDFSPEIDLIRILNARFLESVRSDSQHPGPDAQLSALRAVSLSLHAITGLLRLQALVAVNHKESDEIMQKVLSMPEDEHTDSE
jgi:hypothetical protein